MLYFKRAPFLQNKGHFSLEKGHFLGVGFFFGGGHVPPAAPPPPVPTPLLFTTNDMADVILNVRASVNNNVIYLYSAKCQRPLRAS